MITIEYYHNKFPIVAEMIHTLYNYCYTGGCCHVVTDDNNIYDYDLDFVIEYAKENRDEIESELCIAIAEAMKKMSFLQRAVLFEMMEIDCEDFCTKDEFDNLFGSYLLTDNDILAIRDKYDFRYEYHLGGNEE